MPEPRTTGEKHCPGCCKPGDKLHVLAFCANSSKHDGLHSLCRSCDSRRFAARRRRNRVDKPVGFSRHHHPREPRVPTF